MSKLKLLAIVGSLRKESFNLQLAKAAQAAVADEAELTILDYTDVPFFNQDLEYPAPEAVARVRKLVTEADGLWFFTPEYNHFFPGVLKNLLDWLSRPISKTEPQVLGGKPIALAGITPSVFGTALAQDHMVTLLSFLNVNLMNNPKVTVPGAMGMLDADGKLALPDMSRQFLNEQAAAFVAFIKKQK